MTLVASQHNTLVHSGQGLRGNKLGGGEYCRQGQGHFGSIKEGAAFCGFKKDHTREPLLFRSIVMESSGVPAVKLFPATVSP